MNNDYLMHLNDMQRKAVVAPCGNVLVLAGAGSGKTQVLVHRIAWLISSKKYSPDSIIAVTFTNKAATEMRERIKKIIGVNYNNMHIGTFHSIAYRLLCKHQIDANLAKNFQILDNVDQLKLLKQIINSLNLDEKKYIPNKVMHFINNKKHHCLRPNYIEYDYNNIIEKNLLNIYKLYQEICDRAGLLDFDELLLRAYELWLNKAHILNYYREQFINILIDEFQDTNSIQYSWIRLLANVKSNIMIVGDDDQSIYGWRGAKEANIKRFLDDFSNVHIIRLEQNYRSTNNILKSANILISHNINRLGKNLWTKIQDGERISFYQAINELDEANFVANNIKIWHSKNEILNKCAILYRSNVQSRVLEEALLRVKIPYCIYGGMRFFERQEIKDVLAYLRIIMNRNDDIAYERIINKPLRGIGNRTLNIIRKYAHINKITLWEASNFLIQKKIINKRAILHLKDFIKLINNLALEIFELPLHLQTNYVMKKSGLWEMYKQENTEHNNSRIDNLKELVTAAKQYISHEKNKLQEFLSHVMLQTGENHINTNNSYQCAVHMMTLHASKGLEFSQVFIVGMEEGIFPSWISLKNNKLIEEERRLAYVGVTRAMNKLTLSYAVTRRLYGKKVSYKPSRFINEFPKDCIKNVYSNIHLLHNECHPFNNVNNNNVSYKLGQKVFHSIFGYGTIIDLQESDDYNQVKVKIKFQKFGIKWLLTAYAKLRVI